jgi:hypothetical protein
VTYIAAVVVIWVIYRITKGFLRFNDGKPMLDEDRFSIVGGEPGATHVASALGQPEVGRARQRALQQLGRPPPATVRSRRSCRRRP